MGDVQLVKFRHQCRLVSTQEGNAASQPDPAVRGECCGALQLVIYLNGQVTVVLQFQMALGVASLWCRSAVRGRTWKRFD